MNETERQIVEWLRIKHAAIRMMRSPAFNCEDMADAIERSEYRKDKQ